MAKRIIPSFSFQFHESIHVLLCWNNVVHFPAINTYWYQRLNVHTTIQHRVKVKCIKEAFNANRNCVWYFMEIRIIFNEWRLCTGIIWMSYLPGLHSLHLDLSIIIRSNSIIIGKLLSEMLFNMRAFRFAILNFGINIKFYVLH